MIRIKANKCGYQGFTCRGIPQLESNMFDTTNTFVSDMQAEFEKLPVRIKGMVYTEETIDMGWPEGGPHPEVAELTCRSDTDPESTSTDVSVNQNGIPVEIDGQTYLYPVYGGTSGWSDLFNSHYVDGSTVYFYKEKVWLGITGTETQYGPIADVTSIPEFIEGTTAYLSGGTEYEMRPGLLEPMLETDFDPIDIDTIPGWEAAIDPLIYNGAVVNGILPILEDKISNLYDAVNSVITDGSDENLRNLKDSEYTKSECNNFQITLTAGNAVKTVKDEGKETHEGSGPELPKISDPPHSQNKRPIRVGDKYAGGEVVAIWKTTTGGQDTWHWVIKDVPNVYAISSGVITYGESTVTVAGKTGIYAPFYAYLTVTGDTTTTYVSIPADELPPGTGPDGMLQEGDTLPSGGTVSNLTSEVVSGKTFYSWEGLHDTAGSIGVITEYTDPALSKDQTADPPPGGVGIGGVRVIQGGSNPEDYILYKIYHEDCISEVKEDKEAEVNDAVAGYINISGEPLAEYLANVIIPSGTEGVPDIVVGATTGVVQPVHNIYLFGSSIGLRSESSVDVPTVEAVYNFIHGYRTFKDGDFPQESALATGSTMFADGSTVAVYTEAPIEGYTDSLATPGTVVVAEDIKTMLVDGKTVTATDCVPTAQAVVDYVSTLKGATASTVGIIGFTTNIPEMLLPIPGSTVDPVKGYVQNVQNIYVGGEHPISSEAVPTVDAVYHFIHGTTVEGTTFSSALATAGTMSYHGVEGTTVTGAEQGVYKVVENIVTLDENGSVSVIGNTTAQGYVPEAQAVVDWTSAFVSGYTAAGGTMSLSGDPPAEGIAGDKAGITTVARNIVVNSDDTKRAESPYAVPTVEAVYEFIHGTSTYAGIGILETASALATIGGMTATVSGVTADSYIPGTMNVVGELVGATASDGSLYSVADVVPTADAVVQYIDKLKKVVGATAGTIEISGQTEEWAVPPAQQPTQGAVWVSTKVRVAEEPSLSVIAVPTVKAVHEFVSGFTATGGTISAQYDMKEEWLSGYTGTAGIVTVANNVAMADDPTNRVVSPYTVPTVEAVAVYVSTFLRGSTAGHLEPSSGPGETLVNAVVGFASVSKNIYADPFNEYRTSVAGEVVPTVEAVYNFIKGETVYGEGAANWPYADAHAQIGKIEGSSWEGSALIVTGVTASGCKPGTCEVVSNILAATVNGTYSSVDNVVPTADAVVKYVDGFIKPIAANGWIQINGSGAEELWETDPPAKAGIVQPVSNIKLGTSPHFEESSKDVPTVKAVHDFIHWMTDGGTFSKALASAVAIEAPTPPATVANVATGAVPGTCFVVNSMTGLQGKDVTLNTSYIVGSETITLESVVPTVEAVAAFVKTYEAVGSTISTTNDGEVWIVGSTESAGIVKVARNIAVNGSTNKRPISRYAVPTVEAVYTYIEENLGDIVEGYVAQDVPVYVAGMTATGGTIGLNGSAERWITDSTPGIVKVSTNIEVGDPADISSKAVPTVYAVAEYVATHAPDATYRGPFAVDIAAGTIGGGDVYFDGTCVAHADPKVSDFAANTTYYCVVERNSSTGLYGATIGGAGSSIYTASIPVASTDANAVPSVQLHYGIVNIQGRWH